MLEKIVWNEENAGIHHFFPFPTMFFNSLLEL